MVVQEVFGRYADGIPSQPHPGYLTLCYREHRQSGYIEATAHAESVAYARQDASQAGWIFTHFHQKWIRRAREAAWLFLSAEAAWSTCCMALRPIQASGDIAETDEVAQR